MQKGQSTFDYLILTGVILAVIVPLLFFSTGKIDASRLSELQDALEALKDGITQVGNLGFGTSTVVVVRVPKGVVEQIVGIQSGGGSSKGKQGYLYYKIAGNDLHVRVPADVDGVLPTNEGLHYVQLFNNGTAVLLYECGNNKREAFEQCDGTDKAACDYKSGNAIAIGMCLPPTVTQGACKCSCRTNDQCEGTTRYCDPRGFCGPCSSDSQCDTGKVCLAGRCTERKPCITNNDCSNYGREVCNLQSNFCEPCDPSNPSHKKCNQGDTCVGNIPPTCERIPGGPQLPCRNNDDCGNQVCISGVCGPCTNNGQCSQGKTCDIGTGRCIVTPRIPCGVGLPPCPGGQQCNVNGFCQQPQPGCQNCLLPNRCVNNVCMPPSNQYCGNGKVEGPEFCDEGLNNGNPDFVGSCGEGNMCTEGCTCYKKTDFCGDGKLSPTGWEQCDPNMSPDGCPLGKVCTAFCDCRPSSSSCGDGRWNPAQEECEPGVVYSCPQNQVCLADCTCTQGRPGGAAPGSPGSPAPGGSRGPPPNGGGPPAGSSTGPYTPSGCRSLPLCNGFVCGGTCSPGYSCRPDGGGCGCLPDSDRRGLCREEGKKSCTSPSDCGNPDDWFCVYNCCMPKTVPH